MRVMIVDDHETNRELCRYMLANVAEAIDTFEDGEHVVNAMKEMAVLPDVILLDVMMPVKNGFETAAEIRNAFPDNHIPIIFLTVLDDHDSFERSLALGDDFILKPVERSVLVAKVQAHHRIVKMHKEVINQRDELQHFHEHVKYDYAIAESIFTNLMDEMSSQVNHIYGLNYISTPSTIFNGDLIVVANRPHGGVYVMIADATGHGLPAAISAIPATRAFFSMAAKGMSLGEIVTEINNSLVKFLPLGMMLAASVFEVRANGFEVSWWGGGLPDAYVLGADGKIIRRLESNHMPLGVLKEHEFETNLVHLKLEPNQQIISYTDGITEASNQEGEQFGSERLEKVIQESKNIISNLYDKVQQFTSQGRDDDLSILAMNFPISNGADLIEPMEGISMRSLPIRAALNFPCEVLKDAVVMNEVRQYLMGTIPGGGHLDLICSVLSELFANAIEHGLLCLDSKIKDDPDGFFNFYLIREQKLSELEDSAFLELRLEFLPKEGLLKMELEHNGEGFDYEKFDDVNSEQTYGRGIVLATELCESLQYSKQGKCVTAVYNFDATHHFPSSL
ncbi:ATP-binding SpoIIE family protein phosphatase [Vibrio marisflavi]|uniref:Regulator of RpoS n=1 Tax=Vibrio marisflavi CECT 7928 TaxID=634439 RepID=A0ABM8ZY96_9VIBR|nr:fused response regulator/phosphatase [Vibrio marisflavi]CAH0535847.1 Regulator of RpoS [Vibrio marisflavi CECT 7928]